jgi:hypothetical protein
MMRRRVVGRALVRTAAVGGVAYAAGHHSSTKSAEQQQTDAQQNAQIDDQQQAAQPVDQQPAPPPPPVVAPAPSGMTDDKLEQLKQLGALHESGVLTDAEFDAQKQKILNS